MNVVSCALHFMWVGEKHHLGTLIQDIRIPWEYAGGGFSVDASVCIGADDRVGLERLLRPSTVCYGKVAPQRT
jgi:hypothetical protein